MKIFSNSERTRESGEQGMSLAEVAFSMLVLAVVLAGLAQALTYGIKVNTENKLRVATLNVCKYVTESEKTKISQSQTIFDNTDPSVGTYYVDAAGNKTRRTASGGGSTVDALTSDSVFRVRVVVANSGLTKTVGGVTNVLVKALEVTVVDLQNTNNSGRDIKMRVEIMRPSA